MPAFFALLALAPAVAVAQDAADASMAPQSPLMSALPLLFIFAVFYFLLIRPQQKRMKEHGVMLGALKKGDKIVTAGGIVGKIVEADKDGITTVEIAPGVSVKVTKQSISALADATPAAAAKKKTKADSIVKNDNVVLKKDQIANDN